MLDPQTGTLWSPNGRKITTAFISCTATLLDRSSAQALKRLSTHAVECWPKTAKAKGRATGVWFK